MTRKRGGGRRWWGEGEERMEGVGAPDVVEGAGGGGGCGGGRR